MMFQDTNNDIIANHIENWIKNNVPNEGSNSFARNLRFSTLHFLELVNLSLLYNHFLN